MEAVKKNLTRKPCCSRFREVAFGYLEESENLDGSLSLLADLLLAATQLEALTNETLSELGASLRNYLERRRMVEHFYFGRPLRPLGTDDYLVASELLRLQRKNNETSD